MLVICETCGLPHYSKTGTARKCLVCWKEAQGYELNKADTAHRNLAEKTSDLMEQMEKLKKQNSEYFLKISLLNTELNNLKSQNPSSVSGSISEENLKSLILLCHPDKHANSPISTKITQWLISLRKPK